MTTEHRIGTVDEVPADDSCLIVEVDGLEIGVFRVDDEYYGLANFCSHQSGPLCEGVLRGRMVGGDDGWAWVYDDQNKVVECPWHGWSFDVETGINIDDDLYSVPTYEIEERDGELFLIQ